jgi:threonine/homoserine/homoserine lactone efflux protein
LPPDHRLAYFLAASLALTLTPGPAVLFIVARSVELGRRGGLLSVLGIFLGNSVLAAATSLGLAAALAASPVAFGVVRALGAGYLVLLGARRLVSPGRTAEGSPPPRPEGSPLRQAFVVAVLNPKTALFFLAFLPQFADSSREAIGPQILSLGAVFVCVALLTDGVYALLAASVGAWLKDHAAIGRFGRRASAIVYIGLGMAAFVP